MRTRVLLTIVFALFSSSALPAAPPTMQELQDQIRRSEEEIRVSTELLDKTRKDKKSSQSELKIIRTRLTSRRSVVTTLEKQITLIGGNLSQIDRSVGKLDRELRLLREAYARMVYAAYKDYRLNNFMLFLFSADDFNEISRRVDFMRRYNRKRAEKAAQITAMSDSLAAEKAKLDRTRAEMEQKRAAQRKEVELLGKDEKSYQNTVAQLNTQETRLAKKVKETQAEIEKAQREIQRIIAEEVRKANMAKTTAEEDMQIAALSDKFDMNRGRLPYPLRGGVVIDRFGEHAHQLVGTMKTNNPGINIAGPAGAPVGTVFEGTVAIVCAIRNYNNCVMVRHGNYLTVYANLATVSVKKGDKVSTGQIIGRIDSSPDSDANFLHFEIHLETQALNPEHWLRR